MNTLEQALVKQLTAIPNVLWWHRILPGMALPSTATSTTTRIL